MTYKTVVVPYTPKTKKLAAAIESAANAHACDGWEVVGFSVTPAGKGILMFSVPEEPACDCCCCEQETEQHEAACAECETDPAAETETAEAVGDAQ